jgi:glucokinase
LQDAFELPVVVEKDTCAGLLAEEYYGGIKQVENSLYVSVGSGIGSAVMIGGRLYRGSSSMAGELGHMVINENGPVCRCGQRGCLEAYVCGHRLSEMAKQTSGKHFNGTLSTFIEKTENNYFDLCNVFESVEEGDTRAIRIVRKIGSFLAKCLANAIMLLNPETIFIGGEIYKGRRLLVEVIQEALPRYGLQTVVASASVVPASFDFRQGMMGVTAELLQAAVR